MSEKLFKDFLLELDRRDAMPRTKKKYLVAFRKIKHLQLAKADEKTLDQIFFAIKNDSALSQQTKHDYWKRIRIFLHWLNPELDTKKFVFKRAYSYKMPGELLSLDEVRALIQAASNTRDRVMISLLFDSGCRPHELLNLKPSDVTLDDGLTIRFDGKTGPRRIKLITTMNSAAYLQDYYQSNSVMPEKSLFPICEVRLNHILKTAAARAGLLKRIYPYILRHSRATNLAPILTEPQMRIYFGWTPNSPMPGIYVHLSGRDMEQRINQLNAPAPEQGFNDFLQQLYSEWKQRQTQSATMITANPTPGF